MDEEVFYFKQRYQDCILMDPGEKKGAAGATPFKNNRILMRKLGDDKESGEKSILRQPPSS